MKKYTFTIVIAILLAATGIYIAHNNSSKPAQNTQQPPSLSAKIESAGGQLIDVRTPEEYMTGHANGAINIPLADIQKGDFTKIIKNKPLYVYCHTGVRAGEAKTILEQAGYKSVTSLGALSNWQAQGGLVCKSTKPSC